MFSSGLTKGTGRANGRHHDGPPTVYSLFFVRSFVFSLCQQLNNSNNSTTRTTTGSWFHDFQHGTHGHVRSDCFFGRKNSVGHGCQNAGGLDGKWQHGTNGGQIPTQNAHLGLDTLQTCRPAMFWVVERYRMPCCRINDGHGRHFDPCG